MPRESAALHLLEYYRVCVAVANRSTYTARTHLHTRTHQNKKLPYFRFYCPPQRHHASTTHLALSSFLLHRWPYPSPGLNITRTMKIKHPPQEDARLEQRNSVLDLRTLIATKAARQNTAPFFFSLTHTWRLQKHNSRQQTINTKLKLRRSTAIGDHRQHVMKKYKDWRNVHTAYGRDEKQKKKKKLNAIHNPLRLYRTPRIQQLFEV